MVESLEKKTHWNINITHKEMHSYVRNSLYCWWKWSWFINFDLDKKCWTGYAQKSVGIKVHVWGEVVNLFRSLSLPFPWLCFSNYSLSSSPNMISSIHFSSLFSSSWCSILSFLTSFNTAKSSLGNIFSFCTLMFTVDRNNSILGLL